MTINRETIRDALTTILTTALVGAGKPAQAVYGYQPADFRGQSPVVTISSGPIMRPPMTIAGNAVECILDIHVFVLYDDGGTWNEDDAEDRLDLIECTIADTLQTYRRHPNYWQRAVYEGETETGSLAIGGDEYRIERIRVRFQEWTG